MRTTESRRAVRTEVLKAIHDFNRSAGYPPSYRELANQLGTAHSNIWYAVEQLRESGYVSGAPRSGLARALVLTIQGKKLIKGDH